MNRTAAAPFQASGIGTQRSLRTRSAHPLPLISLCRYAALVCTSAAGPSTRGSSVRTVSCSRTYQPSWPCLRRYPTIAATSTSPGTQRAVHAVTDRLGVGAPPGLHLAGQAEVDVLHVGVGDSVETCRVRSAGSVPPMSR